MCRFLYQSFSVLHAFSVAGSSVLMGWPDFYHSVLVCLLSLPSFLVVYHNVFSIY